MNEQDELIILRQLEACGYICGGTQDVVEKGFATPGEGCEQGYLTQSGRVRLLQLSAQEALEKVGDNA